MKPYSIVGLIVIHGSEMSVADEVQKIVVYFTKGEKERLLKAGDKVEVVYSAHRAEITQMAESAAKAYGPNVDTTWMFHQVAGPFIDRL
jgi:predicted RNA methylase